jgi:hypothetical protein
MHAPCDAIDFLDYPHDWKRNGIKNRLWPGIKSNTPEKKNSISWGTR